MQESWWVGKPVASEPVPFGIRGTRPEHGSHGWVRVTSVCGVGACGGGNGVGVGWVGGGVVVGVVARCLIG